MSQNQKQISEEKNNESSPLSHDTLQGNASDIEQQISDTELEPTASQAIENNLENELLLDDSSKNELISQLKGSNEAMKNELDKITRIATTSQSQYLSLKYEFDSFVKRLDTEKKEIKLQELKKVVLKFTKLLEQLRLFFQSLSTDFRSQEEIK